MTTLVIVHQILNRRWYSSLFMGRYNPYRTVSVIVNVLLIGSFLLTAACGMSMSSHAVPFLYGILPIVFARTAHLALSHWSFILMGLHLGVHLPVILARFDKKIRTVVYIGLAAFGAIGLYLFVRSGIIEYLLFRTHFAFFDYGKSLWQVFAENTAMMTTWVFLGSQCALILRKQAKQ